MTGQLAWRWCYDLLASRGRGEQWSFMNYGYAPLANGAPPLRLDPADEPDRMCIQLYDHVLSPRDLAGTDVLEVGAGRGGGSQWISRRTGARSTTGVDLSARAVDLCTRHRSGPALTFLQGDALDLPLADASVDVVVNVESSHCYPSVPAFLDEVRRVLRPGGALLFADLRDRQEIDELVEQLATSGLRLVARRDISAEVLEALRIDSDRKAALMRSLFPRPLHGLVARFAALRGSRTYRRFEDGELVYTSAHLERPSD